MIHNIATDSEQYEFHLLSCMIIDKEVAKYVQPKLDPALIVNPLYRDLYKIIGEMTIYNYTINRTTISAYLNEQKSKGDQSYSNLKYQDIITFIQVMELEGRQKFVHLSSDKHQLFPIVDQYINAIKNDYIKGRLESLHQDIQDDPESSSIIESLQREVNDLSKNYKSNSIRKLSDMIVSAVEHAEIATQSGNGMSGISTGITDLDKAISGLAKSDLIIIAGRPGMGKTSLATDIAVNVAKEHPVIFFSFEMSGEQLATRILSSDSGVPSELIRTGRLSANDFMGFLTVITNRQKTNLFVDDFPPDNLDDFYLRAKTAATHLGAQLIVIDYLQLLRGHGRYHQNNKVSEVTDISRALKMLAKELNIPIIVLSQLSRSPESRDDKRPQLSDLRDSGAIEQDADIVMFIYRESYYLSRETPTKNARESEGDFNVRRYEWEDHKEQVANEADVIIAKHRHGATSEVKLTFNPQLTRFSNYVKTKPKPLADAY